MSAVLLVVLLAWGLVAWLSIFVVFPSCMQSLFRHRLWRLRDSVVRAIRTQRIVEPEPVHGLIREIECAILAAPEVSPFRITLLRFVSRDVLREAKVESFEPDNVHPADRVLAQTYLAEFRAAFFRQVLFGSPSGWLVVVILAPLLFPVAVVRAIKSGVGVVPETKTLTRNELNVSANPEQTLALLRGRHERDSLSICA